MRVSPVSFFYDNPEYKRHPNYTKTDQLPISEVITGLPRTYHHSHLCTGACGKIPMIFAHRVRLFMKNIFAAFVSLCVDVCPSHTTHDQSISTLAAPVEALYFAVHPHLPAPKTVLRSWR